MQWMDLGLGWIDWAFIAVLAGSLVAGLMRGLVFEVLAIAGWFVAYFVALWGAGWIAPHLPAFTPGSPWNQGAAFACAFLLALVGWGLMARLVRTLIHATPLAPIDRLLGAAFGLVRGGLMLLVVTALVAYTPAAQAAAWRQSIGAGWLTSLLHSIKPLLPAEVAHLLAA